MSTDPTTRLRSAVDAHQAAEDERLAAIIAALQPGSGIEQKEVSAITGIGRETLRRMAREHGIPPAKKGSAQI